MSREELKNKWNNWKNQKHYADDHSEFEDRGYIDKKDIMAELAGQMNQQFLDLGVTKPSHNKKEIKFEQTFAKEIETNACPICFEMVYT